VKAITNITPKMYINAMPAELASESPVFWNEAAIS
jgi:hypothetical protein